MTLTRNIISDSRQPTANRGGFLEQKEIELYGLILGFDPATGDRLFEPESIGMSVDTVTISSGATSVSLTPSGSNITLYKNFPLALPNGEVIVPSENITLDADISGAVAIYPYQGSSDYTVPLGLAVYSYGLKPLGMYNGGGLGQKETSYAEATNQNLGKQTFYATTRMNFTFELSGQVNEKDEMYDDFLDAYYDTVLGTDMFIVAKKPWYRATTRKGITYKGGQAGVAQYFTAPVNVTLPIEADQNIGINVNGSINDLKEFFLLPATV